MLKTHLNDDGVAIGGYDVTEYFKGAPKKGTADFQAEHYGAIYYFANAENKTAFEADPYHFLPQYNGWCSAATSEGKYFYADPESFIVQNDKLYLFWDDHEGGATRPLWVADPSTRQKNANQHWKTEDLTDENLKDEDKIGAIGK